MCGRYSLIIADLGELARRFEFDGDWLAFESMYNVAPRTTSSRSLAAATRVARATCAGDSYLAGPGTPGSAAA